jgi:hypothetical protein
MMTRLTPELARLGDDLEAAVRADIARSAPVGAPAAAHDSAQAVARTGRLSSRGRRLGLVGGVTAVALAAGIGVAAAAGLLTPEDVAFQLQFSDVLLADSHVECEPVDGTVDEFTCTLDERPDTLADLGTVATNDEKGYINGGCRPVNIEDTEWACFLGQRAVEEKIIGPDFLGQYAPGPGVG